MSSDIMPFMAKNVIHISEAEAASNFADVLARVRAGAEIVIDGHEPVVVVVRPSKPEPGRLLSESIALAKKHAEDWATVPRSTPTSGADLEADHQ